MSDFQENVPVQNEQPKMPEVGIQRVYVKDLSFEAPHTPHVFKEIWTPQLNLELNIETKPLEEEFLYEVTLQVSIHVKNGDTQAFLVDVKQAGIFRVVGANPDQLDHILRSFCPQMLYPYAREVVSDLASRGSFPQLLLAPISFDNLYLQEKAARAEKEAKEATLQ